MRDVLERHRIGWVAVVIGLTAMNIAGAQDAEQWADDVVVTATRQQTRLQDTPLAISVYTAEQIQRSGTRDLRDIVAFTPGLTIGTGEGQGAVPVSIRGVGQNDLGIGADAPVAIYLDGVYLARPYMNLFDLVDVERIEVLRGPQGTLYGRNATGGAINVITRKPDDVALDASAAMRYGNYDAWGAQAMATGPISSALSGKLAIGASGHDGYTKLAQTNEVLDPQRSLAVRTGLRWQPSENIDLQLDADGGYHDMPVVFHRSNAPEFDPTSVALNETPREDRDFWGASLMAVFTASSVEITSITAYREAQLANWIDTDASPASIVAFGQFDETSQLSQEIRVSHRGANRFSWLAGVYYFRENADTFSPILLDFRDLLGLPSATTQTIDASNHTDAFAVFGQADFRVTDTLTFSGGLRWSEETKRFTFLQEFTVDIPPLFVTYPESTQETTWSNVSPRLSLDYQRNTNVLYYASYSEGFKSGGSTSISLITAPMPNVFDPEKLEAVEAGIKSDWLDGRLRVNAAAFHYDYENLQVRTSDAFGFLVVRNATDATIDGLEIEIVARPAVNSEITAVAALLDARYGQFIDPVSLADYSGDRLNRSPDFKFSLGAQQVFLVPGGGDLTLRGEYEYMSRYFHQPGEFQEFSRGPSNLFNARIEFTSADRDWSASLLAKNLTNERDVGHAFVVLGTPRATITPPRTVGLEIHYSY